MTIFSKIIKGEIPSYKIAENEKFFAFLDIFPLVEGHTLVIPKIEVDNLFDATDAVAVALCHYYQEQSPIRVAGSAKKGKGWADFIKQNPGRIKT